MSNQIRFTDLKISKQCIEIAKHRQKFSSQFLVQVVKQCSRFIV